MPWTRDRTEVAGFFRRFGIRREPTGEET